VIGAGAGGVTALGVAAVTMSRMHLPRGRPLIPKIKQQGKKKSREIPGIF